MLAKQLAEQDGALQSTTFFCWRDLARRNGEFRKVHEAKKAAAMQRFLQHVDGRTKILTKMCFKGWEDEHKEILLEKLAAAKDKEMEEQSRELASSAFRVRAMCSSRGKARRSKCFEKVST